MSLDLPMVVAPLFVIVFGAVFTSQKVFADGDSAMARLFPQASDIQIAIYQTVVSLQARLDTNTERLNALEAQIEAQGGGLKFYRRIAIKLSEERGWPATRHVKPTPAM